MVWNAREALLTVGFISYKEDKSDGFSFYISFTEDIQWTHVRHNTQLWTRELCIVLAGY